MRRLLLVIFICLNLLWFFQTDNRHVVVHKEGNVYHFANGNWAVVSEETKYKEYSSDSVWIGEGDFDNGKFIPPEIYADYRDATVTAIVVLDILIIALYLLFLFPKDYIRIKDWYVNRTAIPLIRLSKGQQMENLKGKTGCERCTESPDFTITTETLIEGMVYVEGTCQLCGESKKIRLK